MDDDFSGGQIERFYRHNYVIVVLLKQHLYGHPHAIMPTTLSMT
jgi:hypothetical protein